MPKSMYVCGPLTELPPSQQEEVKRFYEQIARVAMLILGVEGFVPHRYYDPIKNGTATPQEVDAAERKQVAECTSCLVVAAIAPSWGGGIEVEIANQNGVPVILLCPREKLKARQISRLLRGNPGVVATIAYGSEEEALLQLESELHRVNVKK